MKKIWNFEDILDLLYLNHMDSLIEDEEILHKRDRQLFLSSPEAKAPPTRRTCLAIWLQERKKEEINKTILPGKTVRETQSFFSFILLLGGVLMGCGLGLSYFVYTGKTPLNVFLFLGVFIAPQLLMTLLLFLSTLTSKKRIPCQWMKHLFNSLYSLLQKKTAKKLTEQGKYRITEILGKEVSPLFFWPFFKAGQLFGLGFNMGLLVTTMVKVITTDLAFGWQSTLQLSSEKLYSLVQIVALPWSWLLPKELSYPSLTEIEGSRIILKDTIYDLLTKDLTSWWPFLILCLLCYGLLPRLLLLIFGLVMEKHSHKKVLKSNHLESIYVRMLTPQLSTSSPQPPSTEDHEDQVFIEKETDYPSNNVLQNAVILVADDIYSNYDLDTLNKLLLPCGYKPLKRYRIFQSHDTDREILLKLQQMNRKTSDVLVVLLEAWMAPIEEQIRFLQLAGESLNEKTSFRVYWLGRPTSEKTSSPPRKQDIEVWQKKFRGLRKGPQSIDPDGSTCQEHQVIS